MKSLFKKLCVAFLFVALVTPATVIPAFAQGRQYEVTFKAGSHGTFANGEKSVTTKVDAGDTLDYVPAPVSGTYEGYRITNTFNAGTEIDGKTVFVYKYTKIVNAVEFTVKYVDTNGVEIETPTIYTTDLGTEEVVQAKSIEGYQPDALQKRLTVSQDNVEIEFIYTPLEDATQGPVVEQIVYIDAQGNVTYGPGGAAGGAGTATGGAGAAAAGQAGTTADGEATQENIEDNAVPQAGGNEEEIDDNDVPQAGAKQSMNMVYTAGGIGVVAIIALIAYLLTKKKKA